MKKLKVIGLLLVVLLVGGQSTFAETSTADLSATGGDLTLSNVPTSLSFPGVTLDGLTWQYTSTNVGTIRVTDARGTGAGWNVTVSATQLTEVGGQGLILPKGNFILYAPSSVAPVLDTLATPPNLATGYGAIDQTPFTVATAYTNTGMGTFDITFPTNAIEVNVEPSAKIIDALNYPSAPTPYTSTLTWTLNNTP